MDETRMKWQPVMLIVPTRIECDCGALAIFVVLDEDADADAEHSEEGTRDMGYTAWCQACFERAQAEVS